MSEDKKQNNFANLEEASFEAMSKVVNRGQRGSKVLDFFFGKWLGVNASKDWIVDSEQAILNQPPKRARVLLYSIFIVLIALIIWSYFAELDEVVRGEGKVIPSTQLQKLQSLDGGVIQEILVKEGQIVEKGQSLLKIDPTRFMSDFNSQREDYFSILGEVTRLRALIDKTPLVFSEELKLHSPQIIQDERSHYKDSLNDVAIRKKSFESQITQRKQELAEFEVAIKQYSNSLALTQREYDVTLPLQDKGAVSEVELLKLKREINVLTGDRDKAKESIIRIKASIEEAENRLHEVDSSMRNEWRTQLAKASARLRALEASETGLADKVAQAEIKSPTRGIVQKLHINTVGGVVVAGRDVVDMVPLDDSLIIEAKIRPQDIAQIRSGLNARIKFTAYDYMIYGSFLATVLHISPDAETDEQGSAYYVVRLETKPEGITGNITIIPGMLAEVDILTNKKTIMQYLMKPILRATSRALTER